MEILLGILLTMIILHCIFTFMNRVEFESKYNVNIDNAVDTGCPFLRSIVVVSKKSNYDKTYFVTKDRDPCPLKLCHLPFCRNYGKAYDNQDRLIII